MIAAAYVDRILRFAFQGFRPSALHVRCSPGPFLPQHRASDQHLMSLRYRTMTADLLGMCITHCVVGAGEAEADFLERHEPGAAAAATEPVPLAGGSSGKTRKTKRRLWGLGPKKSSGESSGSKWKSWGSQGSRSGQLKGPAVAAAATAAAADESDSDVSEVSLGDVAAVMVEEEEEDRSQVSV